MDKGGNDNPSKWVRNLAQLAGKLRHDTNGATAIEYALIAGVIGSVLVTVLSGIATSMNDNYNEISTAIDEAPN